MRSEAPAVAVVHGFSHPVQMILLLLVKRRSTRIVVRHHGDQLPNHPLRRLLCRIAYARADGFTFVSSRQAEPFIKARIIRNSAAVWEVMEGSTLFGPGDRVAARESLQIPTETVFLWVGRLVESKDPLSMLRGFLAYNGSGLLVMIFGDDRLLPQVRAFIASNRMESRIKLVEKVAHEQMEAWYRAADYFVSTSHREAAGYSACEAMACGCIPILTRIPSFERMAGDAAFYFDPGDAAGIAAALAAARSADTGVMRERVLRRFAAELSFDAIGRKLEVLMTSLAGRGR